MKQKIKIKDKAVKKHIALEYLFITFGVIFTSFSFAFFLDPINLVTGGVGGLGIIIGGLLNVPSFVPILILNVLLLIIGWLVIGRDFFNKTFYGSITYPLVISAFEYLYKFLSEKNLIAPFTGNNLMIGVVFGAAITGIGLGLTLRYGGSTGGSEIPQKIMYEKMSIPFSVSLIIVDGIVLFISFIVYRRLDYLLYGIVYILISGFVTDAIVFSGFNSRTVHIITNKPEDIKRAILEKLNRGVTELDATGGYSLEDKKLLICVLSSGDFYKLKQVLEEVDPDVFYYVTRVSEVGGEGFTYGKKRSHKIKKDKE